MEARALKKYIRCSPRKMRLVIDQIRGKRVEDAFNILKFLPNMAAEEATRVVQSAYSNLQYKNMDSGERVNPDEVYVKVIHSDPGPTMRRILPAPQGRAFRIRKRSNHLTVVVGTKN
jgi:large subunit ribosomal protein L22